MLRNTGFTLVELMVVLAVFAVLSAVAVPGLGRMAAEQRVITSTNMLLSALHLARSEAVRRNQRVTLCPSTNGAQCTPGVGYDAGWIVFAGPAAGAGLGSGGEVIRQQAAMRQGLWATGNGSMAQYVSYLPSGQTRQLGGALQMGRITICHEEIGRSIIISRVGRPRVEETSCLT